MGSKGNPFETLLILGDWDASMPIYYWELGCVSDTILSTFVLTLILPSFQNYEIYQAGAKLPLPTISKSSALTKKLLSKHFNYK